MHPRSKYRNFALLDPVGKKLRLKSTAEEPFHRRLLSATVLREVTREPAQNTMVRNGCFHIPPAGLRARGSAGGEEGGRRSVEGLKTKKNKIKNQTTRGLCKWFLILSLFVYSPSKGLADCLPPSSPPSTASTGTPADYESSHRFAETYSRYNQWESGVSDSRVEN